MKSPRDWEWTREAFMYDNPDGFDYVMCTIMAILVGIVPYFLLMGALCGFGDLTPFALIASTIFYATIISHMFWMPKVNRFSGIRSSLTREVGYKYRALSKADRRDLFPSNFEQMLKQANHMTARQQQDIRDEANGIFNHVNERDRLLAATEAKTVDIDDFLTDLRRGREYAQIETKTLKEFL